MIKQKGFVLIVFLLGILSYKCENRLLGNSPETVIDIDGNVYQTVRIGSQVWTLENLRTTKYNDGSLIPNIADNITWERDTAGAFCTYNNITNSDSIIRFGALYNWYAVNTGKLAPTGWRIPTDEDWNILESYLIDNGYNYDSTKVGNKIAKSLASKTDWDTTTENGSIGNNLLQNNRSGFTALPSGYRYSGQILESNCEGIGKYTKYWSATTTNFSNTWIRELGWGNISTSRGSTNCKICGFSVRLIKN